MLESGIGSCMSKVAAFCAVSSASPVEATLNGPAVEAEAPKEKDRDAGPESEPVKEI